MTQIGFGRSSPFGLRGAAAASLIAGAIDDSDRLWAIFTLRAARLCRSVANCGAIGRTMVSSVGRTASLNRRTFGPSVKTGAPTMIGSDRLGAIFGSATRHRTDDA